jgi:hypothetical protein
LGWLLEFALVRRERSSRKRFLKEAQTKDAQSKAAAPAGSTGRHSA